MPEPPDKLAVIAGAWTLAGLDRTEESDADSKADHEDDGRDEEGEGERDEKCGNLAASPLSAMAFPVRPQRTGFFSSSFRLSVSSQATRTIIQTYYFLQPKMSMRPERQPANGNCPTNGLSRSSPANQLTTGSSSLASRISSTQASHLTNSMHLIANQRACRTNVVWVECGGEGDPASHQYHAGTTNVYQRNGGLKMAIVDQGPGRYRLVPKRIRGIQMAKRWKESGGMGVGERMKKDGGRREARTRRRGGGGQRDSAQRDRRAEERRGEERRSGE